MRDKDIIKALKRMSEEDAEGFSSDVLELIQKQQAEIERLNILVKIGKQRTKDYRTMRDMAKTARAEAIREFAKRLGEYIEYRYNENCDFVPYVRLSDVEKVVYEMVGTENE